MKELKTDFEVSRTGSDGTASRDYFLKKSNEPEFCTWDLRVVPSDTHTYIYIYIYIWFSHQDDESLPLKSSKWWVNFAQIHQIIQIIQIIRNCSNQDDESLPLQSSKWWVIFAQIHQIIQIIRNCSIKMMSHYPYNHWIERNIPNMGWLRFVSSLNS